MKRNLLSALFGAIVLTVGLAGCNTDEITNPAEETALKKGYLCFALQSDINVSLTRMPSTEAEKGTATDDIAVYLFDGNNAFKKRWILDYTDGRTPGEEYPYQLSLEGYSGVGRFVFLRGPNGYTFPNLVEGNTLANLEAATTPNLADVKPPFVMSNEAVDGKPYIEVPELFGLIEPKTVTLKRRVARIDLNITSTDYPAEQITVKSVTVTNATLSVNWLDIDNVRKIASGITQTYTGSQLANNDGTTKYNSFYLYPTVLGAGGNSGTIISTVITVAGLDRTIVMEPTEDKTILANNCYTKRIEIMGDGFRVASVNGTNAPTIVDDSLVDYTSYAESSPFTITVPYYGFVNAKPACSITTPFHTKKEGISATVSNPVSVTEGLRTMYRSYITISVSKSARVQDVRIVMQAPAGGRAVTKTLRVRNLPPYIHYPEQSTYWPTKPILVGDYYWSPSFQRGNNYSENRRFWNYQGNMYELVVPQGPGGGLYDNMTAEGAEYCSGVASDLSNKVCPAGYRVPTTAVASNFVKAGAPSSFDWRNYMIFNGFFRKNMLILTSDLATTHKPWNSLNKDASGEPLIYEPSNVPGNDNMARQNLENGRGHIYGMVRCVVDE